VGCHSSPREKRDLDNAIGAQHEPTTGATGHSLVVAEWRGGIYKYSLLKYLQLSVGNVKLKPNPALRSLISASRFCTIFYLLPFCLSSFLPSFFPVARDKN